MGEPRPGLGKMVEVKSKKARLKKSQSSQERSNIQASQKYYLKVKLVSKHLRKHL